MSDWREKEWDEPGPDFGKKFYVKRRPLLAPRPKPQPEKGSTP
jgi:hypothetical protein